MTSTARLLIVAAALTATLAACNRDRPESKAGQKAAEAPAVRASATPLAYDSKTPWAEVELALPAVVKAQPQLHAALYDEKIRVLRQFAEGAQSERTEDGAPQDMPPYAKDIRFTPALETGGLLSLKSVDYEFAGGAHPNTVTDGVLWDKLQKRRLTFADLFAKGADLRLLDQALCSALNTAKRARVPDSASVTLGGAGMFTCPAAADTPFVLAPGTMPGKAGGLTFLIGPYQVGPYVEGAYEIALPVTAFRSLLSPAYAGEFAGQPVKIGDVTPRA